MLFSAWACKIIDQFHMSVSWYIMKRAGFSELYNPLLEDTIKTYEHLIDVLPLPNVNFEMNSQSEFFFHYTNQSK